MDNYSDEEKRLLDATVDTVIHALYSNPGNTQMYDSAGNIRTDKITEIAFTQAKSVIEKRRLVFKKNGK